ncbi:MAG: hypothetical protein ACO2PM_01500 [Pyrobaculum sp.]
METQNSQGQTAERLRRAHAQGSLLEFMMDFAGVVSTYHPNFDVAEAGGGYTLVSRNARWLARLDADGSVEVLAGSDAIRATDRILYNGRRLDRICVFGWRCFDADELRLVVFTHIAAWHWRYREWELRRLACMLRFAQQSRASVGGGEREYVYGSLGAFLNELGRMCGTSKLQHKVSRLEDGYAIAGYRGWQAKLYLNGDVEIVAGDRRIRTADQEMWLDDTAVEEICIGGRLCFSAHDIRVMMFTYIALWHWNIDDRDVIRLLAQTVHPCR